MGLYAHVQNADNRVLGTIDWDGVSEKPLGDPHQIDTILVEVSDINNPPWVGDVWNGTVFVHTEESEEPALPLTDTTSGETAGGPLDPPEGTDPGEPEPA